MNSDQTHINYELLHILLIANKPIWKIIEQAELLNLPDWYIGAGCIAQTVWNHYHGYELSAYINDIDFVYFDNSDLSYEMENRVIESVKNKFADSAIPIDVKNQARVHLWYKEHFGYDIQAYRSIHEAIQTWPSTATSIAVKMVKGKFNVYAPFGTNDLFNLIVRPNRKQITEKIYHSKITRWQKHWPNLQIVDW